MMQTKAVSAGRAARRSVLWRIHAWAALIASPFILVAALTGTLYIFTPQIEALRHGQLDRVAGSGAVRALDEAVAAARAAAPPGWRLQTVLPGDASGRTHQLVFDAPAMMGAGHEGHGGGQPVTVYVDPATAQVVGTLANAERFGNWSRRLHSRLLQGEAWRWMIELAASAMLVMLLTGIALWWPATRQQAIPRAGVQGRAGWKQWHAFLGVALSVLTLAIMLTGLTWSRYAGEQIRVARDALGQASPRPPATLVSRALAPGQTGLLWQEAWERAQARAPGVALQLTPPRGERGVWRAGSADPGRPTRRFDLVLDAADGRELYFAGWAQQSAFGKATAIGIPFHRGEFGWWNQAVLLLFALGVLFSLVSGWVMYFKRRRHGAALLPRVAPGAWRAAALPVGLAALLLSILMPVLAVAVAIVLLVEVFPAFGARLGAKP